jgi:hypothetical protein
MPKGPADEQYSDKLTHFDHSEVGRRWRGDHPVVFRHGGDTRNVMVGQYYVLKYRKEERKPEFSTLRTRIAKQKEEFWNPKYPSRLFLRLVNMSVSSTLSWFQFSSRQFVWCVIVRFHDLYCHGTKIPGGYKLSRTTSVRTRFITFILSFISCSCRLLSGRL